MLFRSDAAARARLAWLSATDVGRSRLISVVLLLAAVGFAVLAIRLRRSRVLARLRPGIAPMVRRLSRPGENPDPRR